MFDLVIMKTIVLGLAFIALSASTAATQDSMFFQIGGDARLYAVVDVSGPWEDLSLAIVDAGTGEILLETY